MKKITHTKSDPDAIFMGLFVSESITLVLKTQIEDGDGRNYNMAVDGILIDMDEHWLYMGDTDQEIREAVKRADVLRVVYTQTEDFSVPSGASH